jgi:hypothetical protein
MIGQVFGGCHHWRRVPLLCGQSESWQKQEDRNDSLNRHGILPLSEYGHNRPLGLVGFRRGSALDQEGAKKGVNGRMLQLRQ